MNAKRVVIAIAAGAVCCLAIWQSARTGLARTLGEYAVKTSDTEAADQAVRLSASDAETHSDRAVVLQQAENYADAQAEIETAIQLRPRDYSAWMFLGITRDENQDQKGAVVALQ